MRIALVGGRMARRLIFQRTGVRPLVGLPPCLLRAQSAGFLLIRATAVRTEFGQADSGGLPRHATAQAAEPSYAFADEPGLRTI